MGFEPGVSRKQRYGKIAVNVFTFVAMLIFSLGAMEFVFRTTHFLGAKISWGEPDSHLGWRYTPHFKYWNKQENDHADGRQLLFLSGDN